MAHAGGLRSRVLCSFHTHHMLPLLHLLQMVVPLVGQFFCGMASITSNSR